MEKDLKNNLYRNPQVANAVNCFNEKLKFIEDKYHEEFSVNKNIILTFNDFEINKIIIGNVSEKIINELNKSFSECLTKFDVEEKFYTNRQ